MESSSLWLTHNKHSALVPLNLQWFLLQVKPQSRWTFYLFPKESVHVLKLSKFLLASVSSKGLYRIVWNCPWERLAGFLGLRMHLQLVEGLPSRHCLKIYMEGHSWDSITPKPEAEGSGSSLATYWVQGQMNNKRHFLKKQPTKPRLNSDPSLKKEVKGGSTLISIFKDMFLILCVHVGVYAYEYKMPLEVRSIGLQRSLS